MLSTCEGKDNGEIVRNNYTKEKPKIVLEYNAGKQGIDVSDQRSSYYSALRKSLTWYKKVAVELIFGTALVNSLIIYQELNPTENVRQLSFVEEIIKTNLLTDMGADVNKSSKHFLEQMPRRDNGLIYRKRCHGCYGREKDNSNSAGARKKAKQVSTQCSACEIAYCLACFKASHSE